MLSRLRTLYYANVYKALGWRTNRKIIVFESDDWGTIRMPSNEAYQKLINQHIDVASNPFNRFDTLENNDDLSILFELLLRHRDNNGNHPVITTNTIMANPDFLKIRNSNYLEYHFEVFTETLKRHPNSNQVLSIYRNGIEDGLVWPQFHGREHVNVLQWLKLLRDGNKSMLTAFEQEAFSIDIKHEKLKRANLMAAYDSDNEQSRQFINNSIEEGLKLFKNVFGFCSKSAIAPAGVWGDDNEAVMQKHGVQYLQGFVIQRKPNQESKHYNTVYRFIGQTNSLKQVYMPRNCYFEPSTNQNYDWISSCIKQIQLAFFLKKPAIISMHRINFTGGLDHNNRNVSLEKFERLLLQILNRWPGVEFMHTAQLGEIITGKYTS